MKLTVLGRCGPYPRAGEACSGYLVQSRNTNLLLECGAGVLSRLRGCLEPEALDAIVLSHLHYDHCADMAVLRYLLEQTPRAPLPVYCPDAPTEALAIFDHPVFERHSLAGGMSAQIGDLSIRFHAVEHPVPCFGMNIEGDARLFYTGDTGWFDGLAAPAADADALLADCCFVDADAGKRNIHLSGRQAGSLAKAARCKALYMSHIYGGGDGGETLQKEVDFAPATVVQEGRLYEITK